MIGLPLFIGAVSTGPRPKFRLKDGVEQNVGSEVIELAILDADDNCLLHSLIDPCRPRLMEYGSRNGLWRSDLRGAPPPKVVHDQVAEIARGRTLVAYNSARIQPFFPELETQTWQCLMQRFAPVFSGREWHEGVGAWRWQPFETAARHVGYDWGSDGLFRALPSARAARSIWSWCENYDAGGVP